MTADKMNTKERLLEAAVHEFAENGFEQATVRDICANAQVNLNAVRYHFGDKMGLYVAAVSHAHVCVTQIVPPQAQTSNDSLDQLRSFISEMLAMALSDERHSTPHELLMLREMASPTEATERIARSFIKPHFERLDSILGQLLPPKIPIIERHLLTMSVVGQCMHFKFGRRFDQLIISASEYRKFTKSRLTDHIMRVVCAAIADSWKSAE